MARRVLMCLAFLGLAAAAAAQGPVFEPDDFVDPAIHEEPLYILRGVAGVVLNPTSHYRNPGETTGFVLITNSLYVGQFQVDLKHIELAGGADPPPLRRCDCPDPVYFPTPPPLNATPDGPPAGRSDTLQVAFYRIVGRSSQRPITLRYRLAVAQQNVDTVVTDVATGQVLEQRRGHDRSITFDADTHFSIGRYALWGSLYVARTSLSGTPAGRAQTEIVYIVLPPGVTAGPFLFRTKLKAGVITQRDAKALNVLNPYFETVWRPGKSRVSFHLVWSLEGTRDGVEGWRTNNQVAIFAQSLYATLLRR